MIFQIIRVSGHSLDPIYGDGDFVFVSGISPLLKKIQAGDTIVFRHPTRGKLIKLVERLENDGESLFVVGLNPNSNDSRNFGSIPRKMVLGKVIGHIRKK